MPAIHLAKLKQQAALLSNNFDQPKVFCRELHDMLDIYAERSHRPGQFGIPPPLIHSYNVPKPVIRQILIELAPLVTSRPGEALSLCDALWEEPYLEFRLLAASILGLIPAEPPDPVLNRVEKWGRSITDDQILTALMRLGLASVRHESLEMLIDIIEDWLSSSDTTSQQMGLRALPSLLSDFEFENLPVFYRLLTPHVRNVSPQLRPYVLDVLKTLARRSPKETAYFLRQNLEVPDNSDTAWIIRQCLHDFPTMHQDMLREVIRSIDNKS